MVGMPGFLARIFGIRKDGPVGEARPRFLALEKTAGGAAGFLALQFACTLRNRIFWPRVWNCS